SSSTGATASRRTEIRITRQCCRSVKSLTGLPALSVFTTRLARRNDDAFTGPSKSARPTNFVSGEAATLPPATSPTGCSFFINLPRPQQFNAVPDLRSLLELELLGGIAHLPLQFFNQFPSLFGRELLGALIRFHGHRHVIAFRNGHQSRIHWLDDGLGN